MKFSVKDLFNKCEQIRSLSWVLGHVEKRIDKKAKVNVKVYDVTDWQKDNWNPHIVQYLKK